MNKNTEHSKSLSDFFSYKYFDSESSLFFNDDGLCGFLLELSPIVGSDESLVRNLELFFNDEMPSNSWIQFLLVASTNIDSTIDAWKKARTSPLAALKKLEKNREVFLNKTAKEFKEFAGRNARNFKLYLSFTQKTGMKNSSIDKIKQFLQIILQKLDTINLAPRVLKVQELIVLVKEILELNLENNTREVYKHYDPLRTISDQILTPGFKHELFEDRVEHQTTKLTSKCYFVSELPSKFSLSNMIGLLGDGIRNSIPGRYILSYVVASNLNKGVQNAIIGYGDKLIDSSEQWYSRNNRDVKREAEEWRNINDRAKNGERFLTENFVIMLTCPSDFITQAEQSLFTLYNNIHWRLEINRHFQFPSLLSVLPMHAQILWPYLKQFKLTRTALSQEIISKLPMHAEWKGVPEPGMLLLGRRGQLFHWNQFYRISSGNYNICVFGPSGSGKSVFLQELATSMMAQDVKIFILDIGQSFKNICQLLEGEIIEFGTKSNIVLNPFSGFKNDILEEDKTIAISYAKAIICSMCSAKGDSLKESIVEKSIKIGLDTYGENLDITKLSEILIEIGESEKGNNEVATNLSHSLFSYTAEGIFGKFFANSANSGKSKRKETKFDKQITVFEFEEIKNDHLLLAVVLQIIGMQIFMQVLTGDRSRRFVLIVDEAWMILDYAAKFLAELARTIRKYGGSLVVCVQNYSDLQHSEQHKAVLQNSTWTVLLKQDEKGINAFMESEAFKDMIPLIKSVKMVPNQYAEMLLYSTGIQVVGRLMLDNYSKILYSTDADVFKGINELTASGIALDEAIEIIEKRKYGDS